MKKTICIVIGIIIIALSLQACSSDNEKPVNETTTQTDSDTTPNAPSVVIENFALQSGDYKLNAVYTYIGDGKQHPTVIFIAGSGPSDYDETTGVLKPFRDIANELAKRGINSLRMDKRTLNYATQWQPEYGIEEEYLIDCRAALDYAKSKTSTGDIYLLGHSLGGQIATIIAGENNDIKGLILFNSSGRNLAQIACDQYIQADPDNEKSYLSYRDAAMNATPDNSKGYYYFGATDFYWATLNKVNTIDNIKLSGLPTLIINSTFDKQCFISDIELWETGFSDNADISIIIDDKISHFGYEIDASDTNVFLQESVFPERIISCFENFIKG